MARELVIFGDESTKAGPIYSNFFGGAAVESHHLAEVEERLNGIRESVRLTAEVKWQKVTAQYLDRYVAFVDEVFDLLEERKLKMRVMFTQNIFVATGLERYHYENQFQILYYHFVKHAFGLQHASDGVTPVRVRFYLDKLPVPPHEASIFKAFIHSLERDRVIRRARILIPLDQIAEVDSHDHVTLQAVDVVLGAMQFRLNHRHREKPPGERIRGKKTRAKEALYKHINRRIQVLYPNFNIGVTTGHPNGREDRWNHPYRHWKFVPSNWRRATN